MSKLSTLLGMALMAIGFISPASAKEAPQDWELVNPAGVIKQAQIEPAPRITTLEDKTVALRWNSKNNGDVFLDRVAELLNEKYPSTKVVKLYKDDTSTNIISGSAKEAERIAKVAASVKADLVIAAQGD